MVFKKILTSLFLFLVAVSLFVGPLVSAQVKNCDVPIPKLKWYQIASPGSFLPIVPEGCSAETGRVEPLSLTSLPLVFLRLYGFLISLSFWMITPVLVVAGMWYIWTGFNDGNVAGPLKYLQNAAFGLGLILVFYLGLFTILGLLGFKDDGFNVTDFFST